MPGPDELVDHRPSLLGHSGRLAAGALMVIALAASVGCARSDPAVSGGVAQTSKAFPRLVGDAVVGASIDSDRLLGQVLVVNVWATWCDPCRREQPALQSVFDRYRSRGVEFLGINYRDNREGATEWTEDFGVMYPSLFDPDGRTAALLGFPFVPDTFIVDPEGTIRYSIFGETSEEELSGLLDGVLGR